MNFIDQFQINDKCLKRVADDFCIQMMLGMRGEPSCFKMLPSYLRRSTGAEQGAYIALDFGGTNVRALLVRLLGAGAVNIVHMVNREIPKSLTTSQANARQLFDFIAAVITQLVMETVDEPKYMLGHTFSFPTLQSDVNSGILVEWAKEFATADTIGYDVNELLATALYNNNLGKIHVIALLNDTVATLLAASYTNPNTDIASICGTGHNTAFFDAKRDMIINLESGNFNLLPLNEYDLMLDKASINPGRQLLEKMTAGRYLGEIFRLAVTRSEFAEPFSLSTQLLAQIANGTDVRFSEQESLLATQIIKRAASLAAASYVGVLSYIDPNLECKHGIAIDGSLYEKLPLYAQEIQSTVIRLLGSRSDKIKISAENRGSSIGGAIAAALVSGG